MSSSEKNRFHFPKFHKKGMLKKVFAGLGIFLAVLVLAASVYVGVQIASAPDISSIDASPEGYLSTILDRDGNKLDSLYISESNRVYVNLDEISADMQHAFVAIEDSRFYKHRGIDLRGILRAFLKGVTSGGFSEGASTITQQLLKNNVLVTWTEENTFFDRLSRKIREQYLAIQLERRYDKDWILENYLNTINLGGGTRGVQVAAQYYFGKDVSELDLAQSALIAGITKNPSLYDPFANSGDSLKRQRLVLDAMLDQGYIEQAEYDEAVAEDVIGELATEENDKVKILSWFEDALIREIAADLMDTCAMTEDEAWAMIYSGGLTIYSTVDEEIQTICENAAKDDANFPADEEISIVVTDVKTGAVVGIVGGRGEKTASLTYNRATEAVRQPGSTIKAIGEYAAGLDLGLFTLGSVEDDEPYAYTDGTEIRNANGTYAGMTTIRRAIANSCNVIALKVFQKVGQEKVVEYLKKFGITTLDEKDCNEPLAIGGTYNGMTNLQLTGAYNAIANGGVYEKPYYYTKVIGHDGKVLLENEKSSTRVIRQSTAVFLTLAMEDVLTSGTGTEAYFDGVELAGKSGTTNDYKDLWFVGYSPYYTCGIWGGYDDNRTQSDGGYVKALWRTIMQQANSAKAARTLADTSGLVRREICAKCGKLAVNGLCDDTLQGDMSVEEYFAAGTEPTDQCDCHVELTVCTDSGKLARMFCPSASKEKGVYLRRGTPGTADAEVSAEGILDTSCDIHTALWDKWFHPEKKEEPEETERPEETEKPNDSRNEDEEEDDDTTSNPFWDFWNSLWE